MLTKFHWNPLEYVYLVGLTKFIFMHYSSVENSKKSKFKVFIYKNLCNIQS
jgi:hypothetical protein